MIPLVAGLAVLLFFLALGRGVTVADVKKLAKGLRGTAGVVLGLIALGLLVAREIGPAFLAAGASWYLLSGSLPPWWGGPSRAGPGTGAGSGTGAPPRASGKMSRAEALKVLGLEEGANEDEIRATHRRLILQTHPDVGGSNYLAAKINEAKDVLVGR